jgi:hypothetical protein
MDAQTLLATMRERLRYEPKTGEFFRLPGFRGVVAGARIGSPDTQGRLQADFLGKTYQVDALVWLWECGKLPPKLGLSHVNGDPADNRFCNLTLAVRTGRPPKPKQTRPKKAAKTCPYASAEERNKALARQRWQDIKSDPEKLATEREKQAKQRRSSRSRRWRTCYMAKWRASAEGKAAVAVRTMLRRVLLTAGNTKAGRTETLLGYTAVEFRQHIEKQFALWMTWQNYGRCDKPGTWQVDHIKPIAAFLAEGVTDPAIINALSNLRPLASCENVSKGARYEAAASDSSEDVAHMCA